MLQPLGVTVFFFAMHKRPLKTPNPNPVYDLVASNGKKAYCKPS